MNDYIRDKDGFYVRVNIKNIRYNLLGVGLPRSGTGYTHLLLKSFGLDVGHEQVRPDGCIDWQLSLRSKLKKPYGDGTLLNFERGLVIRNARNPIDMIPSFITRVIRIKPAIEYIKNTLDLNLGGLSEIESCVETMYAFENIMEFWNPDYIFKVESDPYRLYNFLSNHYDFLIPYRKGNIRKLKYYNTDSQKKTNITLKNHLKNELSKLDENFIGKINQLCDKFEYPRPQI
jgi:hypothetical protein